MAVESLTTQLEKKRQTRLKTFPQWCPVRHWWAGEHESDQCGCHQVAQEHGCSWCLSVGLRPKLVVLVDTKNLDSGINGAMARMVQLAALSVLVLPNIHCRYEQGWFIINEGLYQFWVSGAFHCWHDGRWRSSLWGPRGGVQMTGPCSRLWSYRHVGHHL